MQQNRYVSALGETVDDQSATKRIYSSLRHAILWGDLAPGEALPFRILREKYSASMGAMREALARLTGEGLVSFQEQKGFWVTPINAQELEDLTRMRCLIESDALRCAIGRGPIEYEANLLAAEHRLSRTPLPRTRESAEVWETAHRAFHVALVAGCGSPFQLQLVQSLLDKAQRYRYVRYRLEGEDTLIRGGRDEHKALVEAALDRQAERAVAILTEHYRKTGEFIASRMMSMLHSPIPDAEQAGWRLSNAVASEGAAAVPPGRAESTKGT